MEHDSNHELCYKNSRAKFSVLYGNLIGVTKIYVVTLQSEGSINNTMILVVFQP